MNFDHAPVAMPASHGRHSSARLHGRWRLLARGTWISVVIYALVTFLGSLPVYLAQLQTPCAGSTCSYQQLTPEQARTLAGMGLSLGAFAAYSVALVLALIVVCVGVSTVIVLRRPDERMALVVALMLVALGPIMASESVSVSPSPWGVPNYYLSGLCIALFLLVFSLFPTGRFAPRWMRWPAVVMSITSIVPWMSVLNVIAGHFASLATAFSTLKIRAVNLGFVVFLVEAALLVGVQLYRYRRVASPLQRQQTKWVVFGFVVLILSWMLVVVPYLIVPVFSVPGSLYLPAFIAVQGMTLPVIPLTFGIAMLRYRLWDIDALVNRTLVYGTLTLLLTAIFVGLVVGLQALLGHIGHFGQNNTLAIVFSTLASVALVQPMRRTLQAQIDRHFYRRKYDAAKILAAFSGTLRQEMDLDQLHAQVLAVVRETMQPVHISLWLLPTP